MTLLFITPGIFIHLQRMHDITAPAMIPPDRAVFRPNSRLHSSPIQTSSYLERCTSLVSLAGAQCHRAARS
jgi:hypothetical protein